MLGRSPVLVPPSNLPRLWTWSPQVGSALQVGYGAPSSQDQYVKGRQPQWRRVQDQHVKGRQPHWRRVQDQHVKVRQPHWRPCQSPAVLQWRQSFSGVREISRS